MSSARWSRSECLLCDFDETTFGRITKANSNDGRVDVCIARYFYAIAEKQRGAVDDPLDHLRKIVPNGLSWFRLDDWLEDDVAVRICNVLSGPAFRVYVRRHDVGVIAKGVGDSIA